MNFAKYTKNFIVDMGLHVKNGVGRMMRQVGLDFDRVGSKITDDVACYQALSRHRNILPIYQLQPVIASTAYVAPNATVYGQVFIGKDSYFAFGSVAQGINQPIRVGQNTKIGQNTVLETVQWGPQQAFPLSLNIGNNVNIQHSCSIKSCIIDDNAHVGFRSIVLQGAQLERGCVIAPNSTVTVGTRIPQNTMWAGNPVQFVKNLEPFQNRIKEQQKPNIKVIQHF